MYDTWHNRTALKREAGVDLRGRDNKKPVFHYTLAWHPDEQPTPEQMRNAAVSSLKALKLDEHHVLMAAHNDKDHAHIHLIVNSVHPKTGRTAQLKYSQLELSKWAEAYEREHGIFLQQRIDNNAERAQRKADREQSKQPRKRREPPVNELVNKAARDRTTRPQRIMHNDVIDRMKRLRAEIIHRHHVERDVTRSGHRAEMQELERNSKEAAGIALAHVQAKFKGPWRELFQAQRDEVRHVEAIQGNPLERAVYVFMNAGRLSGSRNLTTKEKLRLIQSPTALFKAVERMHTRERRVLSNVQRTETHTRLERVWLVHEQKMTAMSARHEAEAETQRVHQRTSTADSASFTRARNQLKLEASGVIPTRQAANAPPFETDLGYVQRIRDDIQAHAERNAVKLPEVEPAPQPEFEPVPREHFPTSRAATIKLDMTEWNLRRRGRDDDFEHER